MKEGPDGIKEIPHPEERPGAAGARLEGRTAPIQPGRESGLLNSRKFPASREFCRENFFAHYADLHDAIAEAAMWC
jgi:hypothetical protein